MPSNTHPYPPTCTLNETLQPLDLTCLLERVCTPNEFRQPTEYKLNVKWDTRGVLFTGSF